MAEILHLDLTTCKVEDFAEFASDFEFEVNCDCKITAIGKEIFLNYLFVPCLSLGSNNFWTGPKPFGHWSKNEIQWSGSKSFGLDQIILYQIYFELSLLKNIL